MICNPIKITAFVLSLFFFLLLPVVTQAAIINAASCSIADINTAISSASNGDTVNVPAGDCNWKTGNFINGYVMLNKQINLIGAGSGESGTNITITSGNTDYRYSGINSSVGSFRISGFSFTNTSAAWDYLVFVGDNTTDYRIDNCIFKSFKWAIVTNYGDENNVIDHNTFYGGGVQFNYGIGATEWANDTNLGTNYFTFVEDNTFSDLYALEHISRPMIMYSGRRVVARHNTIRLENTGANAGMDDHLLDCHGYGYAPSANAGRGGRAYEIYNNTVVNAGGSLLTAADFVHIGSGTGVIYNNTILPTANYYRGGPFYFFNWRASATGDSTGASSSYPIDPNSYGKMYCFNGYKLLTNTSTYSYFNQTLTGSLSGASGVIRGWDGAHYVYFTNITGGPFKSGEALKVSGVTIATAQAGSEAYSGEGYPCVDQVGRGKDQASEPVYLWSNSDINSNSITSIANGMQPGYFNNNTDYVISTVKPGYTAYKYPHPLTLTSSSDPILKISP